MKKNNNKFEHINYSVQGELKNGDECIGSPMNDINGNNNKENYVYLQSCDDSVLEQKWSAYNGNILPIPLSIRERPINDTPILAVDKCPYKKDIMTGKNVVLSEVDVPWFSNTNTHIPENFIEDINHISQKYADVNDKMNNHFPQQIDQIQNCYITNGNISLVCLCIIILILLLFKYYVRTQ